MAAGVFVSASLCPRTRACVCVYTCMHSCVKLFICVFMCVCCLLQRREQGLMFALEDCMTSFIPVRIAGIICNLTTASCQKATNRPYGYV